MNKKAIIEIQFNWIFTLIVGALIMALFTGIVTKQKSSSELSVSADLLKNIESILVGAKVSSSTIYRIEMPKTDIVFSCNQYSLGSINKPIRDKIIFSPDIIKGRELMTWTLEWKVPFKITNFLYLTSPLARYILIGGFTDETFKAVNATIPDEINKEYNSTYSPNSILDLNNYKVRIVFFNQDPGQVPGQLAEMGKDLSAIKIDGDIDTGNVVFFENEQGYFVQKGSTSYLKKESLIGAIFMEHMDDFDCAMRKAFKNLNIISNIYLNKSETIKLTFESSDRCAILHDNSNIDIIYENSELFNHDNILTINQAAEDVENQNKQLQLKSCPLIY